MEAHTQEIAPARQKGYFKNRRLSKVLLLVCPEVHFVGHPKEYNCQADAKGLYVVLEKPKEFWPMVQAPTT
jgi:hypothetical protein